MLVYENVRLQLVDLPPISQEYTEPWIPQIIRNADAVLWIVDLSDDDVLESLEESNAVLTAGQGDNSTKKKLNVGNKKKTRGGEDRRRPLKKKQKHAPSAST